MSIKQVACRRFHDKAVPAVPHVLFWRARIPTPRSLSSPSLQVRHAACISFVVAQQFRTPEFHIRFRHACGFRAVFMHMPETAIDEHHRTVSFGNTTSGCPGYRLSFLRNRRPFEKKKTAYHHFNGCVFASDMRHDVASRATLVFLFFLRISEVFRSS